MNSLHIICSSISAVRNTDTLVELCVTVHKATRKNVFQTATIKSEYGLKWTGCYIITMDCAFKGEPKHFKEVIFLLGPVPQSSLTLMNLFTYHCFLSWSKCCLVLSLCSLKNVKTETSTSRCVTYKCLSTVHGSIDLQVQSDRLRGSDVLITSTYIKTQTSCMIWGFSWNPWAP